MPNKNSLTCILIFLLISCKGGKKNEDLCNEILNLDQNKISKIVFNYYKIDNVEFENRITIVNQDSISQFLDSLTIGLIEKNSSIPSRGSITFITADIYIYNNKNYYIAFGKNKYNNDFIKFYKNVDDNNFKSVYSNSLSFLYK